MSMAKLFYCSECNHIYFKLPPNGKCKICGNQIDTDDTLAEDEILTCETCHTIYPVPSWKELIPARELNEEYLCGCRNRCPTKTAYQSEQKFVSVGSIVKAQYFQCSNCHAVFLRGMEDRQKNCSICHSRFVSQVLMDLKKEKPIFECANPAHKIQLKVRDLIIDVNAQITKSIKPIIEKENVLRVEYNKKLLELKNEKAILGKGQAIKNQRIRDLDNWAKTQRWQLFAVLPSYPLYCASYKVEGNALPSKIAGCGAIAEMKIQIVVESDTHQTQIKARVNAGNNVETFRPSVEIQEQLQIEHETPGTAEIAGAENRISGNSLLQRIGIIENDSDLAERLHINNLGDPESVFGAIPTDSNNQFYLRINIYGLQSNLQSSEINRIPVNFGVIPVSLSANANQIRIGKETFIQAQWNNSEFFSVQPLIFENIASLKENGAEFVIQNNQNTLVLKKSPTRLNNHKIQYLDKDQIDNSDQFDEDGVPLKEIKAIEMQEYYPLEKMQNGYFYKFMFEIKFQVPDQIMI